ncbi:family 78 glycoside hydrolase catalytic domain [Nocardia salmonicida]|uniref:alpha-L-rhamnosidase n=1 Tax=Nocardia salmonicida TaxID=53431 RepID=UPI003FCCB46A
MTAIGLETNGQPLPMGIDTAQPEFSWKLSPTESDSPRVAYTIEVAKTPQFDDGVLWNSGRVESKIPFSTIYSGPALEPNRRYHWRVRLIDPSDREDQWSAPAWFETGVLDPTWWQAKWIAGQPTVVSDKDVVYLRNSVTLTHEVTRARAYVTALGWYRFFVNGTDATGPALVPRWTPFDSNVEYQTYDVTDSFRLGSNVVAMAIGDGRYRGRIGAQAKRAIYGDRLAGFAQIEVELANGTTVTIATDDTWRAGPGRIRHSDPMDGEQVDLGVPVDDWLTAENPPERMRPVNILDPSSRALVAEEVPRVREIKVLPPQTITRSSSGKQIVDFGQNLAGVVRIRVSGSAGTTVTLTHSELLTTEGELDLTYLDTPPLLSVPAQRDEITLGGRDEWVQPWFTIHGFRYLEVDGLDHDLQPEDVRAVLISTDVPVTGSFECSHPQVEQLYRNVLWSLRSNFVDTATDCPTRERSGWTGDIQVFAPTAAVLVDTQTYLRRYLRNLAIEQFPDGRVPPYIPSESSVFSGGPGRFVRTVATSVGWGDAAVMIPWTLYQYYGDTVVLERQYDSMRLWMNYLERSASTRKSVTRALRKRVGDQEQYILDTGFHWGEWLRPTDTASATLRDVVLHRPAVATAYFAHSAMLMSKIAEVLGKDDDAQHYGELTEKVGAAWRSAFVNEDGRIGHDRQDDYVRALAFGLLPQELRGSALERLTDLIQLAGRHIGTGFLSTPMILQVLADGGRADIAYDLLMQNSSPSWLSQIERGATSIWENWEGHNKKGKPKGSRNHYAFGAVARWLVEGVAGLAPAEPGYRVVRVAPHIGGGLEHAAASVVTPFGRASSDWRTHRGLVTLDVTIPPGATGEVRLGDGRSEQVPSGNHSFQWKVER